MQVPKFLRDARNAVGIAHVEDGVFNAGVRDGDLRQGCGVAAGDDDPVAALVEGLGQAAADPVPPPVIRIV